MADVGTGAVITFGTEADHAWAAEILSVNGGDISREVIETTHMGTTGAKRFMPGDLYDPGTLDVSVAFLPNDEPPITSAVQVITVTFPVPAGGGSGATFIASGFISNFSWAVPLEDKMTADVTIKFTGAATPPAWADSG